MTSRRHCFITAQCSLAGYTREQKTKESGNCSITLVKWLCCPKEICFVWYLTKF